MTIRKVQRYGWKPDRPDHRDLIMRLPVAHQAPLPAQADLRGPLMPDIYDQGSVGSCTGNSAAAAVQYERRKQGLAPDFVPSRLFIYYNARSYEGDTDQDAGAEIRDAIAGVVQYGAPPETDWPYDVAQVTTAPSGQAFNAGQLDLALQYVRVPQGVWNLKQCLAQAQPVVFGFSVYESFESDAVAQSGAVPMPGPDEEMVGGHAVLLVGYNDIAQRWTVRNSWGPGWGMAGYFTMPYQYLAPSAGLASDFWVIEKMEG